MKRILMIVGIIAAVLVILFFIFRSYTKSFSPEARAVFQQNNISAEVKYCRPSMRNREIFGKIVPYDKVWRTGANEATEIEFKSDVTFAGKAVKAGKYALFSIPKKDYWVVILNSALGQWGAFTYSEARDVLRVEVPVFQLENPEETFSIEFKPSKTGAEMELRWERTKVMVPIEAQK
ncbi:MAG: DUF2911 domain-containing protein [Microscillaceae bacterium]|jgi:hypothetical protein|nr:DUF2911 domain-containing protein [Microscillaceae bacterium]